MNKGMEKTQKIQRWLMISLFLVALLTLFSAFIVESVSAKGGPIVGPEYECVNCWYIGSTVKCNQPYQCSMYGLDGNYAVYQCYDSCIGYYYIDDGYFLGCVDVCG